MRIPSHPIKSTGQRAAPMLSGVLTALALLFVSGCGGGGGGGSANAQAGIVSPAALEITVPQEIRNPVGGSAPDNLPVSKMSEAAIIGNGIMVRSASASSTEVDKRMVRPGTRLTVLDQQGKFVSTVDYGLTLAEGYAGDWAMLPAPGGMTLVQLEKGSKLLQFDAAGKLLSDVNGVNLYTPEPPAKLQASIYQSAAALDGNGFWLATTYVFPQEDGTKMYRLVLTKFDMAGKPLTPTGILWNSNKALTPRLAASGGAVLVAWNDSGSPMLANWAKGAGAPALRTVNAMGNFLDLRPVALDDAGKMAILWSSKAANTGNLTGVLMNENGTPVLPAGVSSWAAESMSSTWGGARHGASFDMQRLGGKLLVADLIADLPQPGQPANDIFVLADYRWTDAALSTIEPKVLTFKRPSGSKVLTGAPALRQLVFANHSVLLIGDDTHLEGAVVTRR
ncbi:hypothetical protein HSX11_01230 [Oxalobacteraceae bacterium]|nr:hypothetical protein [Oxalobacteraceae bacterium]